MEVIDDPILKNIYLENIFTNEEINLIKIFIKNEINLTQKKYICEKTGRLVVDGISFPKWISDKLLNSIGLPKNYIMLKSSYSKYSKEYGKPFLNFHKDKYNHIYMLDYQLDSNVLWNIDVDGNSYSLSNNSGIFFNPGVSVHGRKNKFFLNEDYVEMLFFYFTNIKFIGKSNCNVK